MAKIKHTKNELKAQNEALRRFKRFLPMLQLKEQQLQAEIQRISTEVAAVESEENELLEQMQPWIELFSEGQNFDDIMSVNSIEVGEGNIAGVAIPIFNKVDISVQQYDLFSTPPWLDEGVKAVSERIELKVKRETLQTQRTLIAEELRTTSQRVNLFEKVKVPECKENIRVIKVFLGDEQTAAVARGKIAKKRSERV